MFHQRKLKFLKADETDKFNYKTRMLHEYTFLACLFKEKSILKVDKYIFGAHMDSIKVNFKVTKDNRRTSMLSLKKRGKIRGKRFVRED